MAGNEVVLNNIYFTSNILSTLYPPSQPHHTSQKVLLTMDPVTMTTTSPPSSYFTVPPQPLVPAVATANHPSYYNGVYNGPETYQTTSPMPFAKGTVYTHNPYIVPIGKSQPTRQATIPAINRWQRHQQIPQSGPPLQKVKGNQVSNERFQQLIGTFAAHSQTSIGSSEVQAALREHTRYPERLTAISNEILPLAMTLIVDPHACYVIQCLLDRISDQALSLFLKTLSEDTNTMVELCTKSLHTRRMVQFLLESHGDVCGLCFGDAMVAHCLPVAVTQHGCISLQHVLRQTTPDRRAAIYTQLCRNIVRFSMDPYANYVIQDMSEHSEPSENDEVISRYLDGDHVVANLALDKYASNVLEKMFLHCTPLGQGIIIRELYEGSSSSLPNLLQDSYGNYIVQTTIAHAKDLRDVAFIADRLQSVLPLTPYGFKITLKLQHRLRKFNSSTNTTDSFPSTAAPLTTDTPIQALAIPPQALI